MQAYQKEFIQFALDHQVLSFGEFILKSGRKSPYFYNAGRFNTGLALAKLGEFYSQAIQNSNISFDMLFGPAYKGIPLVTSTAIAFAKQFQRDIPYAFNRKEAKDHGEGGTIVGHALTGNVLIIDDVITAGTAARETKTIIQQQGAKACGLVIALDRQERGQGKLSATQELAQELQIPVISIIKLDDLLDFLRTDKQQQQFYSKVERYRDEYGVAI